MKRLLNWRVNIAIVAVSLISLVKSDVTPQARSPIPESQNRSISTIRPGSQFVMEPSNSGNGLHQNTVVALVQSPDGFLWIGTQEGVSRFDGSKFLPFNNPNQWVNQDLWVHSMIAARDGAIWVGTGSGLNRIEDGRFTVFTKQSNLDSPGIAGALPDNTIEALCEDQDGAIWIGTRQGLTRFFQNQFNTWTTDQGLPSNLIKGIIQTKDGSLWIATIKGLSRFKDGRFTNYTMQNGLSSNQINILFEDRAGTLWIGTTDQGVNRFNGSGFAVLTEKDGLPTNSIEGLTEDEDGRVWIATNGGLTYFENGRVQKFNSTGISLEQIMTTIYTDNEGNIWIGTSVKGLLRIRKSKLDVIGTQERLSNDVINSVLETKDGSVWIGTDNGLNRLKDNKVVTWSRKKGLPDNGIISLFEARDGTLWIGTLAGLCKFNGGRFETFTAKHGLSDSRVLVAAEQYDGTIWFGTYIGLTRYKDGKFEQVWNESILGKSYINDLIISKFDGSIWVTTTSDGLFRIKDGQLIQFSTSDGLPTNLLNSVTEDPTGTLWIGTEKGLVRYHNGKFTIYDTRSGLPRDQVFAVIEDDYHDIWMSSNRGIIRVAKRDFDDLDSGKITRLNVIDYGLADGMRSEECNASTQPISWKTHDNRILFPTINGLVVIDPARLFTTMPPPPVFIEGITADKVPISISQNTEIGPNVRELQVEFTAVSFAAPEKVRFKYKLEGVDKDWVDAQTRRFAVYNGLSPDNYRFHVIAGNAEGKWNKIGATISFRLKPIFYQTWWFICLSVLGVAGSIYGLHRLRMTKSNEQMLKKIALLLPTAMVVTDERNSVKMLNDQFVSHFGYTADEIPTLDSWFSLSYPDKREREIARDNWEKAIATCSSTENGRHESQVTCKDGTTHDIEFHFAQIQGNLVVTFNDVTKRNRAERHLSELAARLQTVREEEREFISREIHDEFGQLLTGIKLEVKWLENRLSPDALLLRQKTSSILELINDTIKAMRNIATEFRPSILDSFGLMEAIEWQVQDFESRAGIRCEVIERTDTSAIDRDRATALFRILQESLTNVARHANATVVIVSLSQEDGNLVLQVEDDGRGITETEITGTRSLGLLGMRERVRQFNGYVRIIGVPGEGTTIIASLPISTTNAFAIVG